jgi:hypothetical protein
MAGSPYNRFDGGGDPLLGGDYSGASIDPEETDGGVIPSLAITAFAQPPGQVSRSC